MVERFCCFIINGLLRLSMRATKAAIAIDLWTAKLFKVKPYIEFYIEQHELHEALSHANAKHKVN